jgi:hypothetical protein
MEETIKKIELPIEKPKKQKQNDDDINIDQDDHETDTPKERQKRVVTMTSTWTFSESELSLENQLRYLKQLHTNEIVDFSACKLISQQINQKIYGYKTQDIIKNKYLENHFIDREYVLDLLVESKCCCYYCKKQSLLLYEYVREPLQWSLDRLDNKFGHNKKNVVIACLNCNLRRRTMYHERYAFTKQLNIIKKYEF